MQDKQKVTLYLPPELHRELKIKAAVETEPMSAIAERALTFYIQHPEVVEEVEASVLGATHQVYNCPECASSVILRSSELISLKHQQSLLSDDGLQVAVAEPLVPASV
ncbi:hypothetical protein [Altericista sp. CCNU0014]|uniref:hypothetical protein n=1 Tax=Altericista sp. CCNU0014 TaxID=3082949 RepID=UPI00384CDFF0